MQLLLDTHVFIWSAASPRTLSPTARKAIQDPSNDVYVSVAAAWEIAIKHGLGKITLPQKPESWIPSRLVAMGFKPLPIRLEHALALLSLPNHHDDPFDRMIVAQAQVEGFTIVTSDPQVRKYPARSMKA